MAGGTRMPVLTPQEITPPNININIHVPETSGGGNSSTKSTHDDPPKTETPETEPIVLETIKTIETSHGGGPSESSILSGGGDDDDNSSEDGSNKQKDNMKTVSFNF